MNEERVNDRIAIITGITGQDGSLLADLLLSKDYRVFGVARRSARGLGNASHLVGQPGFDLVEADVTDLASLVRLCAIAKAHEFYNLAAQSHVGRSFKEPIATWQATALGALNCLEAIRLSGLHTRFYQASTSEMFGGTGYNGGKMLNEDSEFHPRSPYGVAKLAAHWQTVNYRESYRMFAVSGILFNHESPRRGAEFVTRKITLGIAAVKAGKADSISLGNLDAQRDWGWAPDFVRGMWLMLQQGEPRDYVLGTGKAHSVRDFCEAALAAAGIEGGCAKWIKVDPALYRPAEVEVLLADPWRAKEGLGWVPSVGFDEMVRQMVEADCGKREMGSRALCGYCRAEAGKEAHAASCPSSRYVANPVC